MFIDTSNIQNHFSLLCFKFPKVILSFSFHTYVLYLESYHAFDNAHIKMSKIQVHMKQILRYIEIISKISNVSVIHV
jgi:hypothetical protein